MAGFESRQRALPSSGNTSRSLHPRFRVWVRRTLESVFTRADYPAYLITASIPSRRGALSSSAQCARTEFPTPRSLSSPRHIRSAFVLLSPSHHSDYAVQKSSLSVWAYLRVNISAGGPTRLYSRRTGRCRPLRRRFPFVTGPCELRNGRGTPDYP